MEFLSDDQAMSLAIEEAKKGIGWVAPNPAVGCVILDSQRQIIAKGYHKLFGGPHAEINAIKGIKDPRKLKGAHLFVTLEPCSHFGKTPPCAQRLTQYPLKSVTYGMVDPNPIVNGKGHRILKQAGIKVKKYAGNLDPLKELIEKFSYSIATKKAFVTLKLASSLDGQIGMKSGESKWITSEISRVHAQHLRAQHMAVLVGRQTIENDNPSLNVRLKNYRELKNKVVILDPQGKLLRTIKNKNVYRSHDKNSLYVVTAPDIKPFEKYCHHISVKFRSGTFDLENIKAQLYHHGIQSLLVEGGARTVATFLEQRAAQKICLYVAPSIIGHKHGLNWAEYFGASKLSKKTNLQNLYFENLGNDFLISGYFEG